ncbi:TetR family transcriptional regulator [Streptomyces sp. 4.24]|uniref:TetR family transcriptional regulator n=1 Tax=Streptomyces tritrimontium TaxID=3406573 RepID=UPI003BB64F6F
MTEVQPRAMQARAKATRAKIMSAAGRNFEIYGYEGTSVDVICEEAGVGKGSLYFHFENKEGLARAILVETLSMEWLTSHALKLQEIFDTGMILAYRIIREPAIRAALRLSLTYSAPSTYGTPWPDWVKVNTAQLDAAKGSGEIAADVDTVAIAYQISGSWAGIMLVTHAVHGDISDVEPKIALLYRNLFLAIAHPRYLTQLDLAPDRGERLFTAHLANTNDHAETV